MKKITLKAFLIKCNIKIKGQIAQINNKIQDMKEDLEAISNKISALSKQSLELFQMAK